MEVKLEMPLLPDRRPWHEMDTSAVLSALDSTQDGISTSEAQARLKKYQRNELIAEGGKSAIAQLFEHVFSTINIIFYMAIILSFIAKDYASGVVIFLVVAANIIISFYLERKSDKTMEALKRMAAPIVKVCRDAKWDTIDSTLLVPGDIVMLEEGDSVPADVRFLEAIHLEIDEAILTGESLPVAKTVAPIQETAQTALGDRKNMGYSGCVCTHGRGKAVVVNTGMDTQIGNIAKSIMGTDKGETPLQRRMKHMAYCLFVFAGVMAIPVFGANGWKPTEASILYAISCAVAIIPEGLVAVITATLGYGMRQMSKRKVIVRRLDALETLGAITNICSDKTGTLTLGKMTCEKIYLSATEKEYKVDTGLKWGEQTVEDFRDLPDLCQKALVCSVMCNNASVEVSPDGSLVATGDQTEVALAMMCNSLGLRKTSLLSTSGFRFGSEFPFDSSLKRMSYICLDPKEGNIMFTKGATETLIEKCCSHLATPDGTKPLTREMKDQLHKQMVHMADRGLRVLALSFRHLTNDEMADICKGDAKAVRVQYEKDLVFLGMVGIMDPPRPETKGAIATCHRAGITVHMATGDHQLTAAAIAKKVGILPEVVLHDYLVMHANEFDNMSETEIDKLPQLPLVLARCSPDTKVKLVKALHRRGLLCAMTGDGVNDAPAIKAADVGIAMGKSGSDVTKNVAELVLTDDNFSSIVAAIEDGRRIFDNLRKFSIHLMSSNVAECVVLILGLMWRAADDHGSLFPMSPIHILWLNMLTSTPPALALGMEPADEDNMRHPPRGKKEGLFSKEALCDIFYYGLSYGLICYGTYTIVLKLAPGGTGGNMIPHGCNEHYIGPECEELYRARGAAFAVLSILLLILAYNCRSMREPFSIKDIASNKLLLYSCIVGTVLVIPTFYIPYLNNEILKQTHLTWEWGLIAVGIVVSQVLVEAYKYVKRTVLPPRLTHEEQTLHKMV